MLSLTCGIRAQILLMEEKIRAFLPAGMRDRAVRGPNSATGSPRRSITMIPPSAASRTNSDVWMWSSRTEVFLICYIVAADSHTGRFNKRIQNHRSGRWSAGAPRMNAHVLERRTRSTVAAHCADLDRVPWSARQWG